MPERFKLVEIVRAEGLSNAELEAISRLATFFPKSELRFEVARDKVKVHLREVDVRLLRKHTVRLSELLNLRKGNVLEEMLSRVEGIKSYGLKGRKRLYVGYDKERKVKDRKDKERRRGIYYYARSHGFNRQNVELPRKFTNKIIVGDSEEVLKELPDNCVDLVFTSPPYNFGLEYNDHEDGVDWNRYFDKLFRVFRECIRVTKYGGRIAVNVQPLFSDYIPIHHIISNFFMQNRLIWKGEILWEKHNYNCKYTAWGSWKSPSNPYLKYTWEFIEVFCKGCLKHDGESDKADITPEEFKKWVYARWDIAPERNMKELGHPAVFPEELVRRVLKLFSFEGDVILDPFNGVGTTTKVAKELNRRFLGIDISEEYCEKARERLKLPPRQKTLIRL